MKKISIVSVFLGLVIFVSNALAFTGLTIDVTGPGGISVKEVQPGLVTGEIWAAVTGEDTDSFNDSLTTLTGGLQITGGGSFVPFDSATNYVEPWTMGSTYPVALSPDGKTLGHEGATIPPTASGVLYMRSPIEIFGNGPFKLGTFHANLEAGDSIQFLLSGQNLPQYTFRADGYIYNGATGHNLIRVGNPLVVVPEPSSFVLLGMGVFGLLAWGWKLRGKAEGIVGR